MEVGNIVAYKKELWKVLSYNADLRLYVLANPKGKVEAPDDAEALEDLKVLSNPPKSWPFLVAPNKINGGPLTKVFRNGVELEILKDWVPTDFIRPGGAVFFSPDLKLRKGEVLSGVHKNGTKTRLSVGPDFGSIQARKVAKTVKPPPPKDSMGHLMEDFLDD